MAKILMHRGGKLALDDLNTFLSRYFNARRLTSASAKRLDLPFDKRGYGWVINPEVQYEAKSLSIILIPTINFPYEVPKVYVRPELPVLVHPHVEHKGKLCVWDNNVAYDPLDISYIEHLIGDAVSLLKKVTTHQLDSDFDRGFLSYWLYAYPTIVNVNSLCRIGITKTKQIDVAYTSKKGTVFADSVTELKAWLENTGVQAHPKIFAKSFMLTIESTWLPSEYPKKSIDIFNIIKSQFLEDKDAYLLISEMLCAPTKHPMFLVQIPSSSGYTVVGMSAETNAFVKGNKGTEFRHPKIGNGFRDNIIFPKQLAYRANQLSLRGINVERKDTEWVIGRGVNKSLKDISTNTIGIIGLGSVGSGILPILIRAGFSEFILIDGDTLESANIGRHWLGEPHVGMNKAKACEQEIKRMFPWVNVVYSGKYNWQKVEDGIKKLNQCDLIISATGEWASDVHLGELLKTMDLECPVLFAFTEPHAVATHCYLNHSGKFDYRTLFSKTGRLLTPVVKFTSSTQKELPECGGYFQPYGAMELSFGHSMIAEFVVDLITDRIDIDRDIHRVWVGSMDLVKSNGGKWNEDWIAVNGILEKGSKIVTVKT